MAWPAMARRPDQRTTSDRPLAAHVCSLRSHFPAEQWALQCAVCSLNSQAEACSLRAREGLRASEG
eukprot:scaffold28417_cov18-Prasinocladus_malaysianus.AAC.1